MTQPLARPSAQCVQHRSVWPPTLEFLQSQRIWSTSGQARPRRLLPTHLTGSCPKTYRHPLRTRACIHAHLHRLNLGLSTPRTDTNSVKWNDFFDITGPPSPCPDHDCALTWPVQGWESKCDLLEGTLLVHRTATPGQATAK